MKTVAVMFKRTTVPIIVTMIIALGCLVSWWIGVGDRDLGNQESAATVDDYRISFWTDRSERNDVDYLSRANLGFAYITAARRSGDLRLYEAAVVVLSEALDLNPRYAPALAALSTVHLARHDFSHALSLAEQAYKLDPTLVEALAAMGDAQLELGHYNEAAVTFELLHRRQPGATAEARLARLAFVTGRTEEAIERARIALELAGSSPDPSYSIALATYTRNSSDIEVVQ